jgi:KaiC/GvpD/RAD55 family RecA-like ATPase
MAPMQLPTPRSHLHAVRFYPDAVSLSYIVGDFVADGLRANQPAIIIATSEHGAAITGQLQAVGWDVPGLQEQGRMFVLDAQELLSRFIVEGMPDGARFTRVMAPILARAARSNVGRQTRVYGEMVDVLWRAGQTVAAIRLEMLWNHLAHTYEFELLCGYAMGSFYKDTAIEEICGQHTHVVSERGEIARVKLSP